MVVRLLALVGGLGGAAALSQYPEFAQQYTQRLGGQIDALERVTTDFDRSAQSAGLTREAAIAELSGTTFRDLHQGDVVRSFERLEKLQADRVMLTTATPIERMMMPQRMVDTETFQNTWTDFRPAVPLTMPGFVAAAIGYIAGWGLIVGLVGLLLWPFRRRLKSNAWPLN